MAAGVPSTIRFGPYEADLRAGELRKRGAKIKLRGQCFDVLALLLAHPGDVVTREELRARLWPGDVFVDFDNGLNAAVATIREALGDSAERPRFIETLPRRGYRFVAPVSATGSPSGEPAVPRIRLAVLPLANLGGDPEQEYFSDGMTEEVITQLAGIAPQRLGVIARTTSMHYKGTRKDAARSPASWSWITSWRGRCGARRQGAHHRPAHPGRRPDAPVGQELRRRAS